MPIEKQLNIRESGLPNSTIGNIPPISNEILQIIEQTQPDIQDHDTIYPVDYLDEEVDIEYDIEGMIFKFKLVKVKSTKTKKTYYEVELNERPDYKENQNNDEKVHIRKSFRNRDIICFGYPEEVDSQEKAKTFSKSWAELTHKYITTGEAF